MKKVICREGYYLIHSRRIWITIFLLLVMTVLMYSMSLGGKNIKIFVLLDETEEEREFWSRNGELDQDIFDLIGQGHSDHNAGEGEYFWLTPEALELFYEGGPLWEKYHHYNFPERMVLRQMVGGAIAPVEDKLFETNWKFTKMLTDFSAALYTACIFAATFFGIDFSIRGYQGVLFTGKDRRQLFWGKYVLFFAVFLVLAVTELLLAMFFFVPDFWHLPASRWIKGILLRCLCDTGIAMACVVCVFLAKSAWKGFILAFFLIHFLTSGWLGIDLYPSQEALWSYWEACNNPEMIVRIGMVASIVIAGAGLLSAELFQRTELK